MSDPTPVVVLGRLGLDQSPLLEPMTLMTTVADLRAAIGAQR